MDWYGDEIGSCFFENTLATYESSHHPNRSAICLFAACMYRLRSCPRLLLRLSLLTDEDLQASTDTNSREQAMAKRAFTGCVSS